MGRTMMKSLCAVAIGATVVFGVGAGAAFAGEVGGGGKPTPIDTPPGQTFHANSICAFSGQNDDPTGGGNPFEAGHTQSWGQTKNVAKDLLGDGHGASAITGFMHEIGPGVSCNGHTNGIKGVVNVP